MKQKKAVISSKILPPVGPYSAALDLGDLLFISGQLGARADKTLPEDVCAQAQNSLSNIQALLAEAGMSMDNLVKCAVFLTDMNDFAAVNTVYASFFPNAPYPTRSAVAVAALPLGAKVEIEGIAVR